MSPDTSAVTTPAAAEQTIETVAGVIGRLYDLIERETALVQKGEVHNAAALGPAKAELAGLLFGCSETLKANAAFLLQAAPDSCAALKRAEEAFRAVLQRNLVAIATAHAVSEGIVRRTLRRPRQKGVAAGVWVVRPRRRAQSQARPPLGGVPHSVASLAV